EDVRPLGGPGGGGRGEGQGRGRGEDRDERWEPARWHGHGISLEDLGTAAGYSKRRCSTDSPESRSSTSASLPISRCVSTSGSVTATSLRAVLTPSGVIGLSETRSRAPLGIRLTKPTTKMVAVSMSMAEARLRFR